MECNRDEAARAKEIADKKLAEMDIAGAKKFAYKAQTLYPQLDGLSDLLAAIHVYSSAEKRVNGEVDWYAIIGVEPSANDDTIRKHYKHMALALHPDKNKSVGADGAFKILSEAWGFLSNKMKKMAYDQKRGLYERLATRNPSMAAAQNVFPSFASKPSTFWTTCPYCCMHFEYALQHKGNELLCQGCRCKFQGLESQPPPKSRCTPWAAFAAGVPGPYTASTVPRPSREQMVRMIEELQASTLREEAKNAALKKTAAGSEAGSSKSTLHGDRPKKRRRMRAQKMNVDGNGRYGMGSVYGAGNVNGAGQSAARDLSVLEARKMLMDKAVMVIKEKVNVWVEKTSSRASDKPITPDREEKVKKNENENLKVMEKEKEKEKKSKVAEDRRPLKATGNGAMSDTRCAEPLYDKATIKTENLSPANSGDEFDNSSRLKLMSVPDPDFHDFDNDRTEKSFGDNQVWAAYDDDDGMPRYYALVHSVISVKPFKMKVSWLNAKSNSELGPLNWIGSGFYKTCGDFRVGKYKVDDCLNSFSHEVKWSKGPKGAIQIYPMKADVWALYRNWSPDWDEFTPNDVMHKYDMVEVLEDCTEEGVLIAPLVKVVGFKTVFCRHQNTEVVMRIPKEEMFRFSHQVPSCKLTGQEGRNAPAGCWEIDPAAAPLELLQVINVKEEEIVGTAEDAPGKEPVNEKEAKVGADMNMKNGKEAKKKGIIVYNRRH